MDFHAFKRSKALQSPVCLLGWNSKGTSVPVARGSQSSVAVTELIDWRGFEHCPDQSCGQGRAVQGLTCSVPRAQHPSALPRDLLPSQGHSRERFPPAQAAAAMAREQLQPELPGTDPVCQHHWVLLEKTGNGRGKNPALTITQPLSESWDMTCYEHHPDTSITLTHRKSSEMEPSKGRTMLFISSASIKALKKIK